MLAGMKAQILFKNYIALSLFQLFILMDFSHKFHRLQKRIVFLNKNQKLSQEEMKKILKQTFKQQPLLQTNYQCICYPEQLRIINEVGFPEDKPRLECSTIDTNAYFSKGSSTPRHKKTAGHFQSFRIKTKSKGQNQKEVSAASLNLLSKKIKPKQEKKVQLDGRRPLQRLKVKSLYQALSHERKILKEERPTSILCGWQVQEDSLF